MSKTYSWRKIAWVGFLGAMLVGACTVSEGDGTDDNDDGGATTGGKGGSGGKGGTGGTGTGGTGTGGTTTGSGGAGDEGGTTGVGPGGTDGGGDPTAPTCDEPDTGAGGDEATGTPGDDCEPAASDDDCFECIKENCCEEWNNCIGTEPYNVCGWPSSGGEFTCYLQCMQERYTEDGDTVTDEAKYDCSMDCISAECSQIGDETQALAACIHDVAENDCEDRCIAGL